MRRLGKVGKEWLKVRAGWVKLHPANHQNYYVCIYCGRWLTVDEMTLDHRDSRSRRPDLRFNLDNLSPACYTCNNKKGSRSSDEYLARKNK